MGDADRKVVAEEIPKKKLVESKVEIRFKNPRQIKKDIGPSRSTVKTTMTKPVHQKNQGNARTVTNFEKNATSMYGQLPQKKIGSNQGTVGKCKPKEKNVFLRLYPKPNAPKLTSDKNKGKNSKNLSAKQTGSFDRLPVKNSETAGDGQEFSPDLEVSNKLDCGDTSEYFPQIPLRKLSFVVDPKDSIFFNKGSIATGKNSDTTLNFCHSGDIVEVNQNQMTLVETERIASQNGPKVKSSTNKRNDLLQPVHDFQKMSSTDFQDTQKLSSMKVYGAKETSSMDVHDATKLSSFNVHDDQELSSTDVHDVQELSSLDFSTDEEETLADILKFFPILKDKLVLDEDKDSNRYSDDSFHDEIVLYSRSDIKKYEDDVMIYKDVVKLGSSLDEILRQEENNLTLRK